MNIKNKFVFTVLSLSWLIASPYVHSEVATTSYDDQWDILTDETTTDDLFYDEGIFAKEPYDAARTVKAFTRSCIVDPDGIVAAQNLLKEDLYNFTNPLNTEAIQDKAGFKFLSCFPQSRQFFWQLFYDQTLHMNYTTDSTAIKSYLAFNNISLIRELDELAINVNIPDILMLFENIKTQERRIGFMFGGLGLQNKWYFEVRTPLLYEIRNFSLTEQEQQDIEDVFGKGDPDEETKFARRHLISDKLGIGDTRAYLGRIVKDTPLTWLNVGGFTTLPTAFPFARGLYGHHFDRNNNNPVINLIELCDLLQNGQEEEAQEIATNVLLATVDKLSSILLENGLGNEGHVGIGAYAKHYAALTPRTTWKTHAELEYLFPAVEKRFYIKRKNPADFAVLDNPNPFDADADLLFIQQELTDTLFPRMFETMVHPGIMFKFTTAFDIMIRNHWNVEIGYDLWWQQQEKLGTIEGTHQERSVLRKDIAVKPKAFLSKIFGAMNFSKIGKKHDWCFSLEGEKTFIRSGIGKDFFVSFRVEMMF